MSNQRVLINWSKPDPYIHSQILDIEKWILGIEFNINSEQRHSSSYQFLPLPDGDFITLFQSNSRLIYKKYDKAPRMHALHPFDLISPSLDATVTTTKPEMMWHQPSDLVVSFPFELSYTVYYDTLTDFSTASAVTVDGDTLATLSGLMPGHTYFWQVLAKNMAGDEQWCTQKDWAFFVSQWATNIATEKVAPEQFSLGQNYPNPFNSRTMIPYQLPELNRTEKVVVTIFDALGRIVNQFIRYHDSAGQYAFVWDGTNLAGQETASGIYFCTFECISVREIKKIVFIK